MSDQTSMEQKFQEISKGEEYISKEQLKEFLMSQKVNDLPPIKEEDFETVFN